ncbi:MAG TPA: hypothetical protein VI789_08395 [Dehalococcoidia bacterium]|nr:hypothetical protein [Dehalococcoidia bacterium]
MAMTDAIPLIPCGRCGGRMLTAGHDGDSACFTCGNVVYRQLPVLPSLKDLERRPSRGGKSLA